MKTKLVNFKQSITLNAGSLELYEEIMDAKKHSAFTGSKVEITKKEGAHFTVYDGYAYGKNIELKPGELIVQTWRAHEEKWPEDCMSEIVFQFKSLGKNKTKILFEHRNIPEAVAENFKKGWKDYYWEPLKNKYNKV